MLPVVGPIAGEHHTFASLAERAIRSRILDGQLLPGARINEVQLAAQLQISRGPLREALQRLTSQGLVTIRSHRGAFVTRIDSDELHHLYELRIALEVAAIRSAVLRSDARELKRLSAVLRKTERRVATADPDPFPVEGELDFHRRIVAASENPAMIEVHDRTLQRIGLARLSSAHVPERSRAAQTEHDAVVRAIAARDDTRAMTLLEGHLWNSLSNAQAILAAAGASTATAT